MTPILQGRWQTRTFVLWTIGLLVTYLVSVYYDARDAGSESLFDEVFLPVLFWIWLFGLGWDILYFGIQQFKWDRDWPPVFQWTAAAWEGLFVALMISYVGLPLINDGFEENFGEFLDRYIVHYTLVWFFTFFWVQGPMRALFPLWRFHGGRII
jgi:hypothetical protein